MVNNIEETLISRACAEALGVMPYVELDRYLIAWPRRDDAHPQVEKCFRIRKTDGETREFSLEDAKLFRWTECVGMGEYFYVLKRDLGQIARVEAETLTETMIGTIGLYPHHMNLTEDYLYYSTKKEKTMIIRVDLSDLSSAGMDAENEFMNLKEDAWWPSGHLFYGLHDDFEREVSVFYCVDMDIFKAEKLTETPFSLERFWEKPELLKEFFTFETENGICTVVQQSRHSDCYYDKIDFTEPGPVERLLLAGPMTYVWFAGGKLYLAEMNGDMPIWSVDPVTGERRMLVEKSRCFEKDEFGHITGDKPQVAGNWLLYRDHGEDTLMCLEIS